MIEEIEETFTIEVAEEYAIENERDRETLRAIRALFEAEPEIVGVVWRDEAGMKALVTR